MSNDEPGEVFYTPAEVADLFRVTVQTVRHWHRTGRMKAVVLPSGHLRFSETEIKRVAGAFADGQQKSDAWDREGQR